MKSATESAKNWKVKYLAAKLASLLLHVPVSLFCYDAEKEQIIISKIRVINYLDHMKETK